MVRIRNLFEKGSRFLHRRFFFLMLGTYALGAFFPAIGSKVMHVSLGTLFLGEHRAPISPPMILLGVLLVNATITIGNLRTNLLSSPKLLLAGMGANLFLPIVVLVPASFLLTLLDHGETLQYILISLSLISAVPVTGLSVAYTLSADGDMPLALGLLLLSTFLCPWLMPVSMNLVDFAACGDYGSLMEKLKGGASMLALLFAVVVPTILGLALRPLIGGKKVDAAKPLLKTFNSLTILLLSYICTSAALPRVVAAPEWDFLGWALVCITILCLFDFFAGWWIAIFLGATRPKAFSMMFGVGMNNAVAALVLATPVFQDKANYLIPLIFYGMLQQSVASGALTFMVRKPSEKEPTLRPAGS